MLNIREETENIEKERKELSIILIILENKRKIQRTIYTQRYTIITVTVSIHLAIVGKTN